MKQLMIDQRFRDHTKRRQKADAEARNIKVSAGRVVRDVDWKVSAQQLRKYGQDLVILPRLLNQQQKDSNKICSLHEPDVCFITKGKEAKKYEFGNKHPERRR